MVRRIIRPLAVLVAAFAAASTMNVVTPALAATYDISAWRSNEPCYTAAVGVCLHYRTWAEGSTYPTSSAVREFTTHTYSSCAGCTRGGEGAGQRVRNNAASMNNRTNLAVLSFYSPQYSGNADILRGGWAGNLHYTANDNASLRWAP